MLHYTYALKPFLNKPKFSTPPIIICPVTESCNANIQDFEKITVEIEDENSSYDSGDIQILQSLRTI